MRPLALVRSARHDHLVEPYLGVAQHDTASDRSLNLDHDSWIPTGLGGQAICFTGRMPTFLPWGTRNGSFW
jgi:hypothetical protein